MDDIDAAIIINEWFLGMFMFGMIEDGPHIPHIENKLRTAFKLFDGPKKVPEKVYRFAFIKPVTNQPLKETSYRVVNPGGALSFQSWTDDIECVYRFINDIAISHYDSYNDQRKNEIPCIISVKNPDNILFDFNKLEEIYSSYDEMFYEFDIEHWMSQREYIFETGRRIKVKIEKIVDIDEFN